MAMRWHAQRIRCTRVMVLRGYRRGSYQTQSPYSAVVTVVTRNGKHQIQGMLSDAPMTRGDFHRLCQACARKGVRLVATRRHGRQVKIKAF